MAYFSERQKQIILNEGEKDMFKEISGDVQFKRTRLKMVDYFLNLLKFTK